MSRLRCHLGASLTGPARIAREVIIDEHARPDTTATLSCWFLDCPGQSPAWRHYRLSVIHLRHIDGVRPAVIREHAATHEFHVVALDPAVNPVPDDPETWLFLRPINVEEQVTLPDDESAVEICRLAAQAVVDGILPAEPALSGQREPWLSALIKAAAHARGEEHAR